MIYSTSRMGLLSRRFLLAASVFCILNACATARISVIPRDEATTPATIKAHEKDDTWLAKHASDSRTAGDLRVLCGMYRFKLNFKAKEPLGELLAATSASQWMDPKAISHYDLLSCAVPIRTDEGQIHAIQFTYLNNHKPVDCFMWLSLTDEVTPESLADMLLHPDSPAARRVLILDAGLDWVLD